MIFHTFLVILAATLPFNTEATATEHAKASASSDSGFLLRIQGQKPGFADNGVFVTASFDKTHKNVWLAAGNHSTSSAVVFDLQNRTLIIPSTTPPVGLPYVVVGQPMVFEPGDGMNNDIIFNKTDDRLTHKPAKPGSPSSPPGENYWEICPAPQRAPYKEVIFFGYPSHGSPCVPIYLKRALYHSSTKRNRGLGMFDRPLEV